MTETLVLSIGRDAIYTTVLLASPLLLAALFTGLAISIIQAVTQINEATLTFIPKIMAIVIVLVVTAPWMSQILTSYTHELFVSIPEYVK